MSSNQQGQVVWSAVQHNRIAVMHDDEDCIYTATWDDEPAGELWLHEDDQGRMWLNFISVEDIFQRKGIGLSLLNYAVQHQGAIYAAVGMTKEDERGENDTRHLSREGAALVNSGRRNGILKEEWCVNPAAGYGYDNEY